MDKIKKYVDQYGEQHRFLIIDSIAFILQKDWYNPDTFNWDRYMANVIGHQEKMT